MAESLDRSDPGGFPFGTGGFDSFRAARQRYLATMTEASVIAQLEAAWCAPGAEEEDGGEAPGPDA